MFTGIIRCKGQLLASEVTAEGGHLIVEAPALSAQPGDSVAVEGVCLTVTKVDGSRHHFDLALETLALTTLGSLPPGRTLNLEPSLRLGDTLDGHLVLGHVDGVATVVALTAAGDGRRLSLELPAELWHLVAYKGSLAVNGVSLTVAALDGAEASFALVPFTLAETTLGLLMPGEKVNVEADLIARYIARALSLLEGGQGA